ncbi:hypothetical protein [Nocardia sp. NPDC005998]|uniref:hypothetical protein n=1 Tax=Nocardia sp. NPDC005998 TaxID=3156894 RepID=UPI0033B4BD7E
MLEGTIRSALRMTGLSDAAAIISTRIARGGDYDGLLIKDYLARLKPRPAMKDM